MTNKLDPFTSILQEVQLEQLKNIQATQAFEKKPLNYRAMQT